MWLINFASFIEKMFEILLFVITVKKNKLNRFGPPNLLIQAVIYLYLPLKKLSLTLP
jgi:hypothetical protein